MIEVADENCTVAEKEVLIDSILDGLETSGFVNTEPLTSIEILPTTIELELREGITPECLQNSVDLFDRMIFTFNLFE